MPFDPFRPFRLRLRSRTPAPVSVVPPPSEDDSDESSPERERPHFILFPALGSPRKSGEHRLAPDAPKLSHSATDKPTQSTHIAIKLDKPPLPQRSSRKSSTPAVTSTTHSTGTVDDPQQPSEKSTLIRRVTTRLLPSRSGTPLLRSRPSTRTLPSALGPSRGPRAPNATLPNCPSLPDGFTSKEHREAALRERGLLPPRKDLSEQEREADERLGCVPLPASVTFNGPTEAERFKASWLTTNRDSESSDSESGHPVPPQLQSTKLSPSPLSPSDPDVRRSYEGRTDLPPAGRPSFCSSIHPLSTSSHLEVLPEEPSELPTTLPVSLSRANLPLIVSSSVDCLPSPILVESPISCTFSSHCPGSTLESQSQSSHRPAHEKENVRWVPSRGRTTDSSERARRGVGSSLSRLGSRSLSNLRRSVAGSLRVPSSSTLASADHVSLQAPRTAIDPTMHSIGSIIRETRDIQDAECRRLSELAFLD